VLLSLAACSKRSFEHFFGRGETLLASKRFAEAALEFQNATRANPESAGAQFKLAEAYEGLGRPSFATAAYQRACSLADNDARVCIEAAAALLRLEDYASAVDAARAALAADSSSFDAQLLLGSALGGVRRFTEAQERLNAAIATAPGDARGYRAIGELERLRGNTRAAEMALRRALAIDPASTEARVNLSAVYFETGRQTDGIRELRAALDADPTDPDANRAYGSYLVANEQCELAEPYWKRVAEASTDLSGTLSLADYYVYSGRQDDALRVLSAVPVERDGDGAARTRVATILYDRGERSRAGEIVDTVLSADQANVEGLLLKARIALDNGDGAAARELTHRAAQMSPNAVAVRQMLAKFSAPER
jgi:Tfp pilus assembly protein PilF